VIGRGTAGNQHRIKVFSRTVAHEFLSLDARALIEPSLTADALARTLVDAHDGDNCAGFFKRAARLARRLGVDLRVVAITPRDDPATRAAVDALARAPSAAHGSFVAAVAPDAAIRVVELLAPGDVLAVESPRKKRRPLFGKTSFAVRALAAGARELRVLSPRDENAPHPARDGEK